MLFARSLKNSGYLSRSSVERDLWNELIQRLPTGSKWSWLSDIQTTKKSEWRATLFFVSFFRIHANWYIRNILHLFYNKSTWKCYYLFTRINFLTYKIYVISVVGINFFLQYKSKTSVRISPSYSLYPHIKLTHIRDKNFQWGRNEKISIDLFV